METSTSDRPQQPDWYEIRVRGRLAQRWVHRFGGMSLEPEADGTTVLQGPVADQAALHGLLAAIRDAGLPLISVAPVQPSPSEDYSPDGN